MNSKPRIGVTPYFNYDSGEEYIPEGYIRGVEHVGGEMVTLHYDTPLEALKDIVDGLDGLIFAGGPDIHPKFFGQEIDPKCGRINLQRDELELKLFECAALRRLPVFGICRGIQLINVAMGGTLIQDVPSVYPGAVHQQEAARLELWHEVNLVPGTPLAEMYGGRARLMTNSFHHQALLDVADGLLVNATADEGFAEAVTGTGEQFILGTQWHPEISYKRDENSRILFSCFGNAVEAFMKRA